jgi:uncharacterized protein YggT (Ycf19 family)
MGPLDFILNIAALLLWLNWLAIHSDPLAKTSAASLVGTLRKAEPRNATRWKCLATLAAVLFVRGIVYWQISSAFHWTPRLQLGVISLPFHVASAWRGDFLARIFVFSALSFSLVLAAAYFCALLLSVVNAGVPDTDPLQKLVRLHLKWVEKWPQPVKLLAPFVAGAVFWIALHPLLAQLAVVPANHSCAQLLKQSAIIGAAAYLAWKYLIAGVLLLHLLNSYVYLGNHPFWNFVNTTARNLLYPLRWLPSKIGKVDFLPLLGVALVFLAAELFTNPPNWPPGYRAWFYHSLPF